MDKNIEKNTDKNIEKNTDKNIDKNIDKNTNNNIENTIYNLRAHHGLCLAFFVGEGYSSSFAENMANIKSELARNALVRIITDMDVICNKCPKNLSGECESENKVNNYDKLVLENCNISKDMVMPYREFNHIVKENIIDIGKRCEICGNCEWNSLCSSLENNGI